MESKENEIVLHIQIENKVDEVKEMERLEDELINIKAEKFRRKSWLDFLEKILFAWILGILFFYMEFYIESGIKSLNATWGLRIINFLAVVIVGLVFWNRKELGKDYRKNWSLKKQLKIKNMTTK